MKTRMWANAQHNGRPAKYRWPLYSTPRPLPEYRAVTLHGKTRNPSELAGVPQTPEPVSAVSGRSSPYCRDMWRSYCCLRSFFPIVNMCLTCEDMAQQTCAKIRRWRVFGDFLRPAFPASRVQHVSDLHNAF